jgi:hypothetical protein
MDYIYSGQFTIIDKIKFKDYNFSEETEDNTEIIDEIMQHLNNYNYLYNIPEKILLDYLKSFEINKEIFLCEKRETIDNKCVLLLYLIFLNKSTIIIQEKEINVDVGTIIIFPAEWFFYFKLIYGKVIIGNVYEFKD